MVDIQRFKDEGLSKIFSSHLIKSIYPMVDRIDVYDVKEVGFLVFRIFLNDPKIDESNMYEKGMDPHYLIDVHGKKYLKYFGIDKKIGMVLYSNDGEKLVEFLPKDIY